MEYEQVDLELTAEEYDFLTICSRVYHIDMGDWLFATAIICGFPVGFSMKALEIRWKLFFWAKVMWFKSCWMPASEDIVQLRQMRDFWMARRPR